MTSPLTTGGIRGNKKHVGVFHPRSFNMGISRKVWERTGGFKLSRRSDDIEFSIRMIGQGFRVGLIPEAFVYHKRRTSLKEFYRQTFNFGKGRIDIFKLFPKELKPVHALPAVFVIGVYLLILLNVFNLLIQQDVFLLSELLWFANRLLALYILLLFVHAWLKTKDLRVALLSLASSFIQLWAYGSGFIQSYIQLVLGDKKR